VDRLESSVKRSGRIISVFPGHIDNFYILALQIHSGKRHSPPADIFRQGNTCHIREHSLKMIRGTTGDLPKLSSVNLSPQMLLNITNCII